MSDEVLQEIVGKISDLALGIDPTDPNVQWVEGYQQACRDIVLIVARTAKRLRSLTEVLPETPKPL
jgi:hypothetical protein